jgi:hypothetical protein
MSNWFYKALMAVGVVGGSLVTAGVLPATLGIVAVAVGTAAGFFHEAPKAK